MNLLQIYEPGQTPLPHESAAAIGIDLGTTYSVVAVAAPSSPSPLVGEGRGEGVSKEQISLSKIPPLPNPLPQGERGSGPKSLHNIHGHALVPSVVYYAPDGSVEVGYPAKQRYERGEKGVIASVKRLMGRGIEDIKPLLGNLPYDVVPGEAAWCG